MNMLSIGQKIYSERLRQGLTQKELAHRSGVTQANISNFEKGVRDITVTTLFRLCLALNVSPAQMFGQEYTPKEEKFTRRRVENIARAIVDKHVLAPEEDRPLIRWMRTLIPTGRRPLISSKGADAAWHEVRRRLTESEINIILERVNDQIQRKHA